MKDRTQPFLLFLKVALFKAAFRAFRRGVSESALYFSAESEMTAERARLLVPFTLSHLGGFLDRAAVQAG